MNFNKRRIRYSILNIGNDEGQGKSNPGVVTPFDTFLSRRNEQIKMKEAEKTFISA